MIVATPQAVRGRARPLAAALGLPEAAFQTLDRLPEFQYWDAASQPPTDGAVAAVFSGAGAGGGRG